MALDVYYMGLNEERRKNLIGICGDDRYQIVQPSEIIPILPDELQQESYIRNLDTSLVIKKVAPWPDVSSGTVIVADIHRRDTGGYEIDQQPFIMAHYSGALPGPSGVFVNEGDWTGRTIRHFTGQTPIEVLSQISTSGINNYYPCSGAVYNSEGNVADLYNTTYSHTLDVAIDLMRPVIK